jgi:hypothetical protein
MFTQMPNIKRIKSSFVFKIRLLAAFFMLLCERSLTILYRLNQGKLKGDVSLYR